MCSVYCCDRITHKRLARADIDIMHERRTRYFPGNTRSQFRSSRLYLSRYCKDFERISIFMCLDSSPILIYDSLSAGCELYSTTFEYYLNSYRSWNAKLLNESSCRTCRYHSFVQLFGIHQRKFRKRSVYCNWCSVTGV